MPASHQRPMMAAEWGLLLFLSLLWGGSFLFIAVAVEDLPPVTVAMARVVIAAAALLAVGLVAARPMPRGWTVWRSFAVMSLFNNVVPFCLIAWAQTRIFAGTAAVLNATTPLFTVLLAHAFTADEKITPNRLAGVLVGFAGVAVLIGPDAVSGLGGDLLAELAMIGAAIAYAITSLYGRRFGRMGIAPDRAAAGQLTAASVILVPLALVVDRPWTLPLPGPEVWLSVAALGFVSTALAYLIFYRLLATAGATNLMLVTLLIPPSAMALGGFFLDQPVGLGQLAGLALIAIGLAAIDGRLWRRFRPVPGAPAAPQP